MLATLSDRTQLPPFNRAFVGLIAASIIGTGAGAAVLLLTPERMFAQIVPLLLGFATLLFAYSEQISRWLRARAEGRGHAIAFDLTSLKVVLPVSFYGGYFGAGVGILMLGVFSLATGGDYRSANVAKHFVSSLNGFTATLVFATQGAVLWPQTLALAAGTIAGGLIGAYVARASFRATSCACWLSWSVRRSQSLSRGATGFDRHGPQLAAVSNLARGILCLLALQFDWKRGRLH